MDKNGIDDVVFCVMAALMERVRDLGGGMLDDFKESRQVSASSTNEWSPPPRVLHQGLRQEAASMTVCSNAVENLGVSALARETRNVKTGESGMRPAGVCLYERTKKQFGESLRDSEKATMKNYR